MTFSYERVLMGLEVSLALPCISRNREGRSTWGQFLVVEASI